VKNDEILVINSHHLVCEKSCF